MKLRGTITAIVTPFKNQKLDKQRLVLHLQDQISQGVDGVLLLGITGESCTLKPNEQAEIISLGVEEVKKKVPVIVGTDSNCTQTAIEKTRKAKELGADAALIVTPYFNKPTQEGIFKHFEAIAHSVNLPIIIYNHPARSIVPIEIPTLLRIAALPNIVGIKDAAEQLSQASDLLHALKSHHLDIPVFSADDVSTYPLMALGAKGVISVASNLLPKQVVKMVNLLLKGDYLEAVEMHYALLPLFKALFIETNPIPIKTAMNLCGMCMGDFRLPLCDMESSHLEQLKKVLRAYFKMGNNPHASFENRLLDDGKTLE